MKWQPIETAPKDGQVILLNIGYPFSVVGVWNEVSGKWCYANLGIDLFHGEWVDTYFEVEYTYGKQAKEWMPMPTPRDK